MKADDTVKFKHGEIAKLLRKTIGNKVMSAADIIAAEPRLAAASNLYACLVHIRGVQRAGYRGHEVLWSYDPNCNIIIALERPAEKAKRRAAGLKASAPRIKKPKPTQKPAHKPDVIAKKPRDLQRAKKSHVLSMPGKVKAIRDCLDALIASNNVAECHKDTLHLIMRDYGVQ